MGRCLRLLSSGIDMSTSCSSLGGAAADEGMPRSELSCIIVTAAQSATAGRAVNDVMDAPTSSFLSTGSSSRYAGVARYLESLEMAGSDLETPPGHPDTYDKPDDDEPVAGAAKPEMKDDDVTQGSDTSPVLRVRRQVVKFQ